MFIWQENWKVHRQAKAERIQCHQTSFTANAEGTFPSEKEKAAIRILKIMKGKGSLVKSNIQWS